METAQTITLKQLTNQASGLCVSILLPTHQRGRETTQDPIRFKNLLTDAIEQVGDRCDGIRERLESLTSLEFDREFWQHQSRGLAIFVDKDGERRMRLNFSPDEEVYVGDQFLIRSIAGRTMTGGTLTLAVSRQHARLFKCDGTSVEEVTDSEFPVAVQDLVLPRDAEEQLQLTSRSTTSGVSSSATGGTGATSQATFHGHGEGEEKLEADQNAWLNQLAKRLADRIYNKDLDAVILATREVAGQLRSQTDLCIADVIEASPDGITDTEIVSKILKATENLLPPDLDAVRERLGTAMANGQGSSDLESIVVAAANGKIDTLIIGDDSRRPGNFSPQTQQATCCVDGLTDLLNMAVANTIAGCGEIVRIHAQESPHAVAAIYRY